MTNPRVDFVLLDWARVLRDVSWSYASSALAKVIGWNDKQAMKDAFFPALLDRERGAMERNDFWDGVIRAYDLRPTESLRCDFIRAYQCVAGEPFPEMLSLLRKLRKCPEQRDVVLLSNGAPEVVEVAEASVERKWVDGAFYSCRMGFRKPQPEAFQYVLDRWNKKPQETLFVDDQEKNVEAAQKMGMQVVHFQGVESVALIENILQLS